MKYSDTAKELLDSLDFTPSQEYIDFLVESPNLELQNDSEYISFYSIDKLVELNKAYEVIELLPGFFLIGSDGGGEGYVIKKDTGEIYRSPFIGMDVQYLVFKYKSFKELLDTFN